MKRLYFMLAIALATGAVLGVLGSRRLNAQEGLKSGTILQRTDLASAKGMEAILVLREVPPGKESGKHTQSGNEIVYILDGSVVLDVQGKPPKTIKAGEAFTTGPGQVHNVKNASSSAPVKALAFYIAKKGAALEELAVPAK
jgi:quercetin dioxygenase-like cupin family protein